MELRRLHGIKNPTYFGMGMSDYFRVVFNNYLGGPLCQLLIVIKTHIPFRYLVLKILIESTIFVFDQLYLFILIVVHFKKFNTVSLTGIDR